MPFDFLKGVHSMVYYRLPGLFKRRPVCGAGGHRAASFGAMSEDAAGRSKEASLSDSIRSASVAGALSSETLAILELGLSGKRAPLTPPHRPSARIPLPRAGRDPRRLTRTLPCSACFWDARRSRCETRGPCCVACSPAEPGQVARRERQHCTRQDDCAAFACKSRDDR